MFVGLCDAPGSAATDALVMASLVVLVSELFSPPPIIKELRFAECDFGLGLQVRALPGAKHATEQTFVSSSTVACFGYG